MRFILTVSLCITAAIASAQPLPRPKDVRVSAAAMELPVETHAAGQTWSLSDYRYDGAGNVVATGNASSVEQGIYLYDARRRLASSSVTRPSGVDNQQFSYDAFGNVTLMLTGSERRRPMVNTLTNSLLPPETPCPAGDICYYARYDASGAQTWAAGFDFHWDALGALRARTSGGASTVYVYNADNERIAQAVVTPANTEWRYTARAGNRVVREFRDVVTGNQHQWTWEQDWVRRGGTLIAALKRDQIRHYHLDHLQSPRLVTDAGGRKVAATHFRPFGEEGPGSDALDERHKFTGHERDDAGPNDARDIDYMHARYYDPIVARFLSVDIVSGDPTKPQTWNRYSYVTNHPMNAVDPDGNYLVDFHHDVTQLLALAAGAHPGAAKDIAARTQGIDDNLSTQPINTPGVQADYHFTSPERLESLRASARSGSYSEIGTFLHALQDSYSHNGFSAGIGHYGPVFSGASAGMAFGGPVGAVAGAKAGYDVGHSVDEPASDVPKAMEAAYATYAFLQSRMKDGAQGGVSWDQIKGDLEGYFANSQNPTLKKFYYDRLCKTVGCTAENQARDPNVK